jgi:hypothetical protein
MHSIYTWLASGNMKPTFEGWATIITALVALLAAVIAYRGIVKQIEADRENLRKQLDEEKQARMQEHESHIRSLATALLFEIDNFYMRLLIGRAARYKHWDDALEDPAAVELYMIAVGVPFAIYEGSAGSIGDLEGATARSVVVCYGALSSYLELSRNYEKVLQLHGAGDGLLKGTALPKLRQALRTSAEQAVKLAQVTCKNLCLVARVEFSNLMIAREATQAGATVPGTGNVNESQSTTPG